MPFYPSRSNNRGAAFPSNPGTGESFTRTDRGREYFWDGTRWLSHQLSSALLPWTITQAPSGLAATTTAGVVSPLNQGDNGIYADSVVLDIFVGATNTGAAFWSFQPGTRVAAGTITNVGTAYSTGAVPDAVNNFGRVVIPIGAVLSATAVDFVLGCTKTGAPSNVFVHGTLYFRLVG